MKMNITWLKFPTDRRQTSWLFKNMFMELTYTRVYQETNQVRQAPGQSWIDKKKRKLYTFNMLKPS